MSYFWANGTGSASVAATFGAGFSGAGYAVLSAADATTLSGSTLASLAATPVGSTTASSAISFTTGTINAGPAAYVSTTITASATAAVGYYNVTITDPSGSVTINDAFYVAAPPTITSMTPTTLTVNQNGVAASVTGTGFESGASATLTSASGATLSNTLTYASPTSLTGTVSGTASGTYLLTVTNPDGGSASSTTVGVTVTGPTVTSFSPTAIAYSTATGATNVTTVTVNGTGFEAGAYVTIAETGGANTTAGATTLVSATQVTFPLTISSNVAGQVTVTVHNPDGGTAASSGTIGINANSASVTPTVTSVTPALTLAVGGSAQLTITGTGFGLAASGDTVAFLANDGLPDSAVVCNPATVISDTQISCLVNVNSGAISGAHGVTVTSSGNTSTALANGLIVAGPTITAVSPATVPTNYAGTYTLTGTGFSTTATNVPVVGATPTGNQTALAEAATLGTASTYSLTGDAITGSGVAASTTVTNTALSTSLTLSNATTAWLSGTNNVTISGSNTGNVTTDATPTTSATLTVVSAAGIDKGMTVTGGNLAAGATYTVASVSGTTVTLNASTSVAQTAGGSNATVNFTETVTATQTASAVVNVSSTTGVVVGQTVSGTGVFAGSTVASIVSGTSVTLSHATTAPIVAGTTLTFTNVGSSTGYTATVASYNAAASLNGGPTSTTASVTSATSMTVQGIALTGVAGGFYVITVNFGTGTVNVAVPEVVPPNITGVSYASSSLTGIGQGASNQTVYVAGSGFLSGATVSFPSTSGVSATVTSVTPNLITLSVSATSTAAVTVVPVTVTNTTGGSYTSSGGVGVNVEAAPTLSATVPVSPASVIAGATAATITLNGTGFVKGATITSSSPLLTIGAVTWVSSSKMTFTAAGPAINGTVNVGLTLTLTNPDGGVVTTGFSINPQPTVTGTYYVPTFSTNYEVSVTGTGFESGMTATSSNSAFSVLVAGVNSTGTVVTLLVTTTSAATTGTSSNITLTNLDGSTVTFALNGGTAPVPPKPVVFKVFRVFGVAMVGKTVTIKISGSGFYAQPKITSNVAGVKAVVSGDTGTVLTVRVAVAANSPRGVHTFTVRLANGKAATVNYNTK